MASNQSPVTDAVLAEHGDRVANEYLSILGAATERYASSDEKEVLKHREESVAAASPGKTRLMDSRLMQKSLVVVQVQKLLDTFESLAEEIMRNEASADNRLVAEVSQQHARLQVDVATDLAAISSARAALVEGAPAGVLPGT